MELDDVVTLVREALEDIGPFVMTANQSRGYVDVRIRVESSNSGQSGAPEREAKLWTSGAEAFFLSVDGGLTYREFDWEPAGQVATVRLLTMLAVQYLQGRFEEKEERRALGRRRRVLEIPLAGERYRFD